MAALKTLADPVKTAPGTGQETCFQRGWEVAGWGSGTRAENTKILLLGTRGCGRWAMGRRWSRSDSKVPEQVKGLRSQKM